MIIKQGSNAFISGKICNKDPEAVTTSSGSVVYKFSVKYGYDRESKSGKFMEIDTWDSTIGRGIVELLQKGDQVMATGELRSYEGKDGKTYWSLTAESVYPDIALVNAFVPASDGEAATEEPPAAEPAAPEPEFEDLPDDTDVPF